MLTSKISTATGFKNYSEFYVKGLNYLLSDDSSKAIETFSELIEVDADTVETHMVLGNLFRSKGEDIKQADTRFQGHHRQRKALA